jgi:hypothetical protein
MTKCKQCSHDCHCSGDLHADEYGTCACKKCECKPKEEGLVVDDTGECEWCQ